ncbi:ArsR/SmtB family transcription factor [Pseudarthrobacter sp. NPDC058329]|jgi:DNA-binding transcriptional ArsR family regulator|uniref:ArsR/SmtB family transcription factor n=1 Tax=Pseudarthrobacter sp. NPDC058329 TaxID=3346448 RepID=UPI0036DF15E3
MRQNEGMPRYVQPSQPAPPWAADVMNLLGINPLRLEILRFLAQNADGGTSGDIGRAVGAGYKTVAWHLRQLESLKAVESGAEGENRQGQRLVYKLRGAAFEDALMAVQRYVRGS